MNIAVENNFAAAKSVDSITNINNPQALLGVEGGSYETYMRTFRAVSVIVLYSYMVFKFQSPADMFKEHHRELYGK